MYSLTWRWSLSLLLAIGYPFMDVIPSLDFLHSLNTVLLMVRLWSNVRSCYIGKSVYSKLFSCHSIFNFRVACFLDEKHLIGFLLGLDANHLLHSVQPLFPIAFSILNSTKSKHNTVMTSSLAEMKLKVKNLLRYATMHLSANSSK